MRPRHSIAVLTVAFVLSGCAAGYVLRVAYEEARILWRRRPIERVLAGEVDAATRERLEVTLAARSYARDVLGLSVGGSYGSLAEVDEGQVIYVVTAAPRDRLVPYTWWFPIAGRIPYRGYFDRGEARSLAAGLEREGYDTYTRSSVAFSTLGWFDDPLLSNLLRLEPERLVEVVLHELLHSTIYLSGQTAFNESFASFVGGRGAIDFFTRRGEPERARHAADLWADTLTFSRVLAEALAELETAYAKGVTLEEREKLFEATRERFRSAEWRTSSHADMSEAPLNNAVLVHLRLYYDRLWLFEAWFREKGEDLNATIAWVEEVARDAPDPFLALGLGADAQTSILSSRRIPNRIEPKKTSAVSDRAAANDEAIPSSAAPFRPPPVRRVRKMM